MKFHKTEGIIINKHSLRDADRFLTIFTPDYGKISLFAKGVRNITSSRIAKLNLFSHIHFDFIEGVNNRRTLTHVTLLNSYRSSKHDLANISRLFEIGEITDGLLPEDQQNLAVYKLLLTALENLHRFQTKEYMHRFKRRLLKELGYGERKSDLKNIDLYIESILERPLSAKNILN